MLAERIRAPRARQLLGRAAIQRAAPAAEAGGASANSAGARWGTDAACLQGRPERSLPLWQRQEVQEVSRWPAASGVHGSAAAAGAGGTRMLQGRHEAPGSARPFSPDAEPHIGSRPDDPRAGVAR